MTIPPTTGLAMEARGLVKRYGHVTALDHMDFELRPQEILAVVGDNGAGKSSLIKALSGALIPDAGEVFLDGRPVRFRTPLDARRAGIEIRYYNIIYNLVDDVKQAMSGLLAPTLRETALGTAEVLEIFNISKVGKIAGCRVTNGKVERGANVRLIRDNVVIHEGKLSQLKRFKDDVREVIAGQECGMAFENYQDMRQGDVIECYRVETVQRSL